MELRQLRYFVTVAEEGNISRAAQKVFLTQPALSRQIKALEESIGQQLLDRQAHSIRLLYHLKPLPVALGHVPDADMEFLNGEGEVIAELALDAA